MKRKCIMATIILTLIMALLEGCGSSPKTDSSSEIPSAESGAKEDETKEDKTEKDTTEDDKAEADTKQTEEDARTGDRADEVEKLDVKEDSLFIGGKVRSVSSDSFVLSRTLVDDEGVIIAMPEAGSPEEELVTVQCTDSTIFERWTIQGNGSDIDRTEAAFSEIKVDDGLEAQGYFEGEEFVAEKVIIEVYK